VIELDVAEFEGVPRAERHTDGLGGADDSQLASPDDRQAPEKPAATRGARQITAEHP
jgi:hypothetical protein